MQKAKINEIKKLVQEVFPDFLQEELKDITPKKVRQYIRRRLPSDVLYATAVLIPSKGRAWERIKNLCNYLKTVKYWASL
jgi:uncharacterized membrane protein YheB (UPF0754 family)